jgi:Na+-driven multidrug efflux pump
MARRSAVRTEPPHLGRADLERARRIRRVQLRAALTALALLTVVVVGLPLLLAALPELDDVRLAGIRVSWLAVAVLPYGALVAIAVVQLRRAERVERNGGEEPR